MTERTPFTIHFAYGGELIVESLGPVTYRVRLTVEGVNATVPAIHHYGGDFFDSYFTDLAASWRGWAGERSWRSLEDALEFHASMAKPGTVALRVVLRNNDRFNWCVTYRFSIENAFLNTLAESARAFGQPLKAAT